MAFGFVAEPLFGGIMIGLAASLLLLMNGRIFGVSSILAGGLQPAQKRDERLWRLASLFGFLVAGLLFLSFHPQSLTSENDSLWRYILAGLLVGFGTQLGGGCTSGHGVCGVSRLSRRSILATLVFIVFGMLTVAMVRMLGGMP